MLPLILTLSLVHLMAVISPGPDLVVCMKNTLKYNRTIGVWTSLGFALGVLVHITYCLLGVALLISQSILWFNILKLLGAGYLIYLGIKSLLSKSTPLSEIKVKHSKKMISPLKALQSGFLTNLLNPKATLYFLGFFSVVIPPDITPFWLGIIIAVIFLITFIWFAFVATVLAFPKFRKNFLQWEKPLDKVFGGVLILLGLKVATAEI